MDGRNDCAADGDHRAIRNPPLPQPATSARRRNGRRAVAALRHSQRSASTGLMFIARRAGTILAHTEIATRIAVTAANVTASVALVENSSDATARVAASATTKPITMPVMP